METSDASSGSTRRLRVGDAVYYDGNRGSVVAKLHDMQAYRVRWHETGNIGVAWRSDLMTEAEYHAYCEEFE